MASFGTAEYWRQRANEARIYLQKTTDPVMRSQLQEIIDLYERLAQRSEPDESET